MAAVTVINNLTYREKSYSLDLSDLLSTIRDTLINKGIMQSDNYFMTNGSEFDKEDESKEKLGDLIGEVEPLTLVVGRDHTELDDSQIDEDIRQMEVGAQKTYFELRGLNNALIINEKGSTPSSFRATTWDVSQAQINPVSPVTKKRTELSFNETARSITESGVIEASVSLDTPFGGGEAAFRQEQSSSSSSRQVKQFMVSKFVVQKFLVEIDTEDIFLDPTLEAALSGAFEIGGRDVDTYGNIIEILEEWGYYAPAGAILGGALYATDEATVSDFASAQSESTEFSAAVKAKFKGIGGGASFSKADGKDVSDSQTTKYEVSEFTQIGGARDAVIGTGSEDFRIWSESLRDPENWAIIEYTDLVPVIALLKDKNLAKRCAQIITETYADAAVRNMQKVINMWGYAAEARTYLRSGGGL